MPWTTAMVTEFATSTEKKTKDCNYIMQNVTVQRSVCLSMESSELILSMRGYSN